MVGGSAAGDMVVCECLWRGQDNACWLRFPYASTVLSIIWTSPPPWGSFSVPDRWEAHVGKNARKDEAAAAAAAETTATAAAADAAADAKTQREQRAAAMREKRRRDRGAYPWVLYLRQSDRHRVPRVLDGMRVWRCARVRAWR